MAEKNQATAPETVTAGIEVGLEVVIEWAAIRATLKELAKTWARQSGNPGMEKKYADDFSARVDKEVSLLQQDMISYRQFSEHAKREVERARSKSNIDWQMLSNVLGLGQMEGMTDQQAMEQAYISSNNSMSLVANMMVLRNGAQKVLDQVKEQWASHPGASAQQVDTFVDTLLEQQKSALLEKDEFLDKQVNYLIGQVNFRHTPAPGITPRKPGR